MSEEESQMRKQRDNGRARCHGRSAFRVLSSVVLAFLATMAWISCTTILDSGGDGDTASEVETDPWEEFGAINDLLPSVRNDLKPDGEAWGTGVACTIGPPHVAGDAPIRGELPLIVTRTGARVTPARIEERYRVSYTPDPSLRLTELSEFRDATGFDVAPFRERTGPSRRGAHDVQDAGEIVAVAIAQELARLRFHVLLRLNASMVDKLGAPEAERVTVTEEGGLEEVARSTWEELLIRWRISGVVKFWIEQEAKNKGERVTASIELAPLIWAWEAAPERDVEPSAVTVYRPARPLELEEAIESEKLSGSAERQKEAARRVLRRVVSEFLGDPELEAALVDYARRKVAGNDKPER